MPDVRIDESASPAAHRAGMVAALAAGRVDNRFHYVGERSATMWRDLASAHSPAQAEDGLVAHDVAARTAMALLPDGPVHVIGVACGDGVKERRLLGALVSAGRTEVHATAVDVSVPLVSAAAEAMAAVPGVTDVDALAVDIVARRDLSPLLGPRRPGTRLVTLFGMMSTLGPVALAPTLSLLQPGDVVMVSANLLPRRPGAREEVMAQYDTAPTREWLAAVLDDIGLAGAGDVTMRWREEAGSLAIIGEVTPTEDMTAHVEDTVVVMPAGRPIRLLESFRHDPAGLEHLLREAGLDDIATHASPDGEEGVAAATAR